LLDFEHELARALGDCGVPRDDIRTISAEMIARAFARIGESRKELATIATFNERAQRPLD
jgi:hypothetical protein